MDAAEINLTTNELASYGIVGQGLDIDVAAVVEPGDANQSFEHANGVELRRTVYLYGVAGRQRTPMASAILKMLRAADWSRYTG